MNNNSNSEEKVNTYHNINSSNHYNSLYHEKITKALVLNGGEVCEECQYNETVEIPEEIKSKHLLLVKCNGILGTHFSENVKNIELEINDNIIIKVDKEFEYATVLEQGDLVNLRQIKNDNGDVILTEIDRKVTEKDSERNISNNSNCNSAKSVFLKFIRELNLDMKLVDIHMQFDRKKMYFFYTADGRVDFRELAKKLASHFKTRIELRQIGVRDEAKRIGGLATCGREFCCSSFLSNFKRITTDIAVENNISTSISKYTGPCGKLKCCLSFEIEEEQH